MNKSPNFRVIVAEPVVMQPRLHIMPLPLEPNTLVGQLSPHVWIVGCLADFWLFSLLGLSPLLNIAGVVRHPFRQMVGSAGLSARVPELIRGHARIGRIR